MYEEELATAEFPTEEDRREFELEFQKQSILAMWRIARLDVEGSVRAACAKVMRDEEQTKQVLKQRAQGLKALGKLWKSVRPEKGKEGCWEFFADLDKMAAEGEGISFPLAHSVKPFILGLTRSLFSNHFSLGRHSYNP